MHKGIALKHWKKQKNIYIDNSEMSIRNADNTHSFFCCLEVKYRSANYLVYDEEKSIYDSIDKTQGDLHERENNLRL